ncbi:MAG: 1-aminocyclopropane-1-carboxylate deaminase/D-cysteine desulfhydrase [Chitinophagaceae bacterium]
MLPGLAFNDISVDNISSFYEKEIEVAVLRLDKISPLVSGNKWFKLRYYLEEAKAQHKKGILTFGGAWSNHVLATAVICNMVGLKSIGIIRGEEPQKHSATLIKAKELGMQLIYISRTAYQNKEIPTGLNTSEYHIVNEGGYGSVGAKGGSTILDYCNRSYTHYCCAAGTGTMMAGLINAVSPSQQVLGISVMKNNTALDDRIQELVIINGKNRKLIHDYHFGGYAKQQPALLGFMNEFYKQTHIPSDFVYTGKLFYAISDLIGKNYFPAGSKLLVIHSGGLQGNISLPPGTLIF